MAYSESELIEKVCGF